MKTGILITARLGSSRLKRKHLLEILGRPIIYYLIERIRHEFEMEIKNQEIDIFICTSDEEENRAFEPLLNTTTFYGAVNNIPYRHLQNAYRHSLDYILAIDGDDILCSIQGMRAVYTSLINGDADYVETTGLPLGMNSVGYSTGFLQQCIDNNPHDILETGWGRIFDKRSLLKLPFKEFYNNEKLRFTLDYEVDFQLFERIISLLGSKFIKANDDEIIALTITNELYKLNESISEEYWRNFSNAIRKEEGNIE